MKNYALAFVALLSTQLIYSQCGTPGFVCMPDGNVIVSDGFNLFDDGFGGPYTDTDYTLVLCPDTPGDVVQLTFNAFALQTFSTEIAPQRQRWEIIQVTLYKVIRLLVL
jgi:hypothetical protein